MATFVTSIPAYFIFYAPVRDDPSLITGTGADPTTSVALGAALEVFLIIANVGTAVVMHPILQASERDRRHQLRLGPARRRDVHRDRDRQPPPFLFMRQEATARTDAGIGEAFVAVYDRAFLLGPGFFGSRERVILGYLMYRSGLVPRAMAMLGLIGGPLVMASGIAIMFDVTERGSALQGIATIPEFFWELSLGICCIVKGFRSSPILDETVIVPESPDAVQRPDRSFAPKVGVRKDPVGRAGFEPATRGLKAPALTGLSYRPCVEILGSHQST